MLVLPAGSVHTSAPRLIVVVPCAPGVTSAVNSVLSEVCRFPALPPPLTVMSPAVNVPLAMGSLKVMVSWMLVLVGSGSEELSATPGLTES